MTPAAAREARRTDHVASPSTSKASPGTAECPRWTDQQNGTHGTIATAGAASPRDRKTDL